MNQTKQKIGIMGGTFNPIHNGHLLLAEAARDTLYLDQVLFMPSGNSYMKDSASIVSKEDRIQMTALAIQGNPYFSLSLLETLKNTMPNHEFYFILGADSLYSIDRWKNPEIIMKNCILTAAVREGNLNDIEKKARSLKEQFQAEVILLPERNIDISSTEIRQRLKDGRSVKYMLPDQVLEYIREKNLYQA